MSDRKRLRATWEGYGEGVYFVTICSHGMRETFGQIYECEFTPSPLGMLIQEHIAALPKLRPNVEVCAFVIMPNHIHLMLSIGPTSRESFGLNAGCLKGPEHDEALPDFHHNSLLASVTGAFKAGITREARRRRIASAPIWQARFYDHIIRNQREFQQVMKYIDENVEKWERGKVKLYGFLD